MLANIVQFEFFKVIDLKSNSLKESSLPNLIEIKQLN